MAEFNQSDKDNFLYPRRPYHGDFTPENLAFNANLQEFAQRVGYITDLETAGKIPSEEAYRQIKELWTQFNSSKEELGIGNNTPPEAT
ncbi:hypothetical protein [Calothrix sp. UHCC 0171]|uniref:DUF7219 family protein n=1 Tax=Calothrix sp. UHCC 0171 TaxID=3110245 RepID=UPI002B21CC76|nr:hypothetical protein [Calothrix sp. UHCC 0171]MEA5572559.1 hypothetical protein [Calothrix sp. UHCC 0171]